MSRDDKIFGTITADGTESLASLSSTSVRDSFGFFVHLSGTFGSGTVTLQFKAEDGNWRNVAGASFTEATDKLVLMHNNTELRFNVSGSTSPSIFYQLSAAGTSIFNV